MNNREAIFVIESLRSGIPTQRSTRLLPDIRESVSSQIISDLTCLDDNTIPAGSIIWGQYGQGKTHALTAIEHLARIHWVIKGSALPNSNSRSPSTPQRILVCWLA